jgi:hypothetical protein
MFGGAAASGAFSPLLLADKKKKLLGMEEKKNE